MRKAIMGLLSVLAIAALVYANEVQAFGIGGDGLRLGRLGRVGSKKNPGSSGGGGGGSTNFTATRISQGIF